jgi:phosphatidate cytidylyltransferase
VTDREGRDQRGEDLFEDLDKFFAPIQDVDWPETDETGRTPAGDAKQDRPGEDPGEDEEEDATTGEPEPSRGDTAAFEAAHPDGDEEEPEAAGPTPGQEGLFAEPSAADEPVPVSSSQEQGSQPEEDDGVSSFLSETEEEAEGSISEEEAEGSISEEAFSQAPSEYVDLPGPDEEAEVADLEEGEGPVAEPAPDLEAVEAAADHFAESVRDEVRVEPDDTATTEDAGIAALLGEEQEPQEAVEAEPTRTVRVGPEGLGGPSWQEPTALEVGAEPERRGAGRDVPLAFLTGLVLAALALGSIAIGAGPFAVLAGAVVLFAQGEFYLALQKRHYQPATALGLVSGALVLGAGYYRGEDAMLAIAALSIFAAFLWYMTVPVQHRRNVVTNVALTVLGVVYIPMLAGYALSLLDLPLALSDRRDLVLAVIGLTIVYDISAFGVGYLWGSRPLAPNISPKKSWEGAIGATLVVVGVAVGAVAPLVALLETVPRAVGLAVVVAVFAPLGDLAESLLKRDLGIKDIGSILPGHGGVLDRIDSILFVAPAAFLYLRLVLQ